MKRIAAGVVLLAACAAPAQHEPTVTMADFELAHGERAVCQEPSGCVALSKRDFTILLQRAYSAGSSTCKGSI